MPFKSKKQERYMWATDPQMAKEWAAHTPNPSTLPEYATKKPKRKKRGK
jgi:hypothetical protein